MASDEQIEIGTIALMAAPDLLEALQDAWSNWQEAAVGYDASRAFTRLEATLRIIEPSTPNGRNVEDVILRSRLLLGIPDPDMEAR